MIMKEDYVHLYTDLIIYILIWNQTVADRQPPYSEVRAKIRSMLEDQFALVNREGWSTDNYKQSRFAICAWIDELIMNSSWDYRQEWQKDLLQTEYYRTTNAGEEFFERLAELHPEHRHVREIFHLCLCLGFKGRYCWDEDQPKLNDIIRNNYTFLPEPFIEVRDLTVEKLIPEAYEDRPDIELPPPKRRTPLSLKAIGLFFALPPVIFILLFLLYRFILGSILDNVAA
jgi:type VI secretion system protein ImpK